MLGNRKFKKKNGIFQMQFKLENNTFRQKKNDSLNRFIGCHYAARTTDISFDFVKNDNSIYVLYKLKNAFLRTLQQYKVYTRVRVPHIVPHVGVKTRTQHYGGRPRVTSYMLARS